MDCAAAFPLNSVVTCASTVLGVTTTLTGAFTDVQPGMTVTKSSGTGSFTGTPTVVSVAPDRLSIVISSVPASTGTATVTFSSNGATVGPTNANGFVFIHGVTLRETAGSTASVTLREGTSTGKIIAEFGLVANSSLGAGLLPLTRVNGNVYCVINGGAVAGVLYIQ